MYTKNVLQKKLFELVSRLYKSKETELDHYVEVLNLSRAAIYERIKGKVPISIDEANALLQYFELSWEQFLEASGQARAVALNVTVPRSIATVPEEYITALHGDIVPFAKKKGAKTWHECSGVPIFWLKYSRLLAAFKLYFWFKAFHSPANEKSFPLFNGAWAEQPAIRALLDQSKEILKDYQTVPGLEIWSRDMFDRTIASIKYLRETGNFAEKDLVPRLSEELSRVAQQMERMAKLGNKAPDGSGGALEVYENCIFAPSNTLVGTSEETCFLYLDVGYPDFIRSDAPDLVAERGHRFSFMLRHLEPVSNSERGTSAFFRGLYDRIESQLSVL